MSSATIYFTQLMIRLKLHETDGESFQKLFSEIMFYKDSRFKSVAPYGNWGDGGNDGWIPEDSHYFQLYAPHATTVVTPKVAVDKAVDDFDKLVEKWGAVEKYTFVMNDKFKAIPAPVQAAVHKLKADKTLLHADTIGCIEIINIFLSLAASNQQMIIGFIPSEIPDSIDVSAVGSLLSFIANKSHDTFDFLNISAPNFDAKIQFNGISPLVAVRLTQNSYQTYLIDEFLSNEYESLRESVSIEIRELYARSKVNTPSDVENAADLRYFWMVEQLIPSNFNNIHTKKAYHAAAELILAKYFETCDAYEHPDSINS